MNAFKYEGVKICVTSVMASPSKRNKTFRFNDCFFNPIYCETRLETQSKDHLRRLQLPIDSRGFPFIYQYLENTFLKETLIDF